MGEKGFKGLKWDVITTGILYILLGLVALLLPETMEKTLGYLLGIVLILAGAISMIMYLLRDAHENYYHNEFVFGLVGIALGILVLYKVEFIISLIPFLLGLLVLVSGCTKLQDVIDMKRLDLNSWIPMLVLAVINVLLGVLLIYNPFQAATLLFRLLGIGLILSGATDVIATLFFAAKLRQFIKDQNAVDTTFTEVTRTAKATTETTTDATSQTTSDDSGWTTYSSDAASDGSSQTAYTSDTASTGSGQTTDTSSVTSDGSGWTTYTTGDTSGSYTE